MINWIDLVLLLFVLYLQIRNLVKYGASNGALKKRLIMMASIVFLIIHVIRLATGITTGLFLLMHVITWVMLYDGFSLQWVLDKLKRR